jgi:hypothetical protein
LVLALAAPASGVVHGTPDQGAHPYVGTLVLTLSDGSYHYWCSGTMVTPQVFVSAGHCMIEEMRQSYPGSTLVGLTLDEQVEPSVRPELFPGEARAMDGWPGPNWAWDIGVYILDDPIPGLDQADLPELPEVGEVGDLDLTGKQVTIVGYGWDRARTGGPNGLDPAAAGTRRYAQETVTGVNPRHVHLLSTIAAGASGMCYGDSGAPRLYIDGERTILIATSWWLGTYCQAPERPLRLDSPAIHGWLSMEIASVS